MFFRENNWFIRLLKEASWNIGFTEEIITDIKWLANTAVDFCINKTKISDVIPWHITNPYTNTKETIQVIIYTQLDTQKEINTGKVSAGTGAFYNDSNNSLGIFPYNLGNISNFNKQEFISKITGLIQHEMTHAIDPKIRMDRPQTIPGSDAYYNLPIEFDAYCKQIIEELRGKMTNTTIKDGVLYYIQTNNIGIDNPISAHSKAISAWINSDKRGYTDYIRRFKTRLYNELFRNITSLEERNKMKQNPTPQSNRYLNIQNERNKLKLTQNGGNNVY